MGRKLAIAFVCVVVIAALIDLRVGLRGNPDPIEAAEMEQALQQLEGLRQPGDLVVHSPLFSVTELRPLGALRASPDRPADQLMKSRRVLALDRADAPMYLPGEPARVVTSGRLQIRLYEPSASVEVVLYDLIESITENTMRIERNGRVTSRCTRPRTEGGFGCPGEREWLRVEPTSFRIGGEDTPCIWAHPTTGGIIKLTIPPQAAPPAGRQLELALSVGMSDDAVRGTPDGASVTTTVFQQARSPGKITLPNRLGWTTETFGISPEQPIELQITTPKDGRRHHCINARIRERPQ